MKAGTSLQGGFPPPSRAPSKEIQGRTRADTLQNLYRPNSAEHIPFLFVWLSLFEIYLVVARARGGHPPKPVPGLQSALGFFEYGLLANRTPLFVDLKTLELDLALLYKPSRWDSFP